MHVHRRWQSGLDGEDRAPFGREAEVRGILQDNARARRAFLLMAVEAFPISAATNPIHTLAHLRDLATPLRRNA